MAAYDRSSKWLIQHHGDSLLRLAGVDDVVGWRALQSELVQTGQLPDGLLEVERRSHPEPHSFIVEIATYPERRLEEQLLRATLLVLLDRRVVPDVVALILRPKGKLRVRPSVSLPSPDGWSEVTVRWRLVELWKVAADALLRTGDPGLMPWVPLTHFAGSPELILQECRKVIELNAGEEEQTSLLAVTQVLTGLRYNDSRLMAILGGREIMIESPVLEELKTEWTAETTAVHILRLLDIRFGPMTQEIQASVRAIQDLPRLEALFTVAAGCASLEAFRAHLQS